MAETTSNMTKRSEYEKCLFDNQTLRDYNTTLLQRLNSGRHKKVVYWYNIFVSHAYDYLIKLNHSNESFCWLCISNILLVLYFSIGELYMQPSDIFETDLHTLLLGGGQQFMFERFHASLKAFCVEVCC